MFLPPILSAVLESFANISDKLNLNNNKISGITFTAILFLFMGILCLPLLYFFRPASISLLTVIVLGIIIAISFFQNYLFYMGLANKHLNRLQPILDSLPIISILLASIIYPSERNPFILLLGIITSTALFYSHLDKNELNKFEFKFDKYSAAVFLSVLLMAILQLAYKYILIYVSPMFLYGVRATGVAIILLILVRPSVKGIKRNQYALFILSAILYSVSNLLLYLSINKIGISLTAIVVSISPVVIYLFSPIFLKEKLSLNRIIGSFVIICCVIASIYFH